MQVWTASGMDDNAAVTQMQLTVVKDEMLSAIRQMIAELRIEFRGELKTGLQQLRDDLTEQMRQIETNMLMSFHSYGKGISHRMRDLDG